MFSVGVWFLVQHGKLGRVTVRGRRGSALILNFDTLGINPVSRPRDTDDVLRALLPWASKHLVNTVQAGDYGLLPVPGKPGHYNETGDSREPGLQVVETPSGVDVSVNGKPAGKLSGNMARIRKALEAKKVGPTTKNEGGIADTRVLATVEPGSGKFSMDFISYFKRKFEGLTTRVKTQGQAVVVWVHTAAYTGSEISVIMNPTGLRVSCHPRANGRDDRSVTKVTREFKYQDTRGFKRYLDTLCDEVRQELEGNRAVATVEPSNTKVTRAEVEAALRRGLKGLDVKIEFSSGYIEATLPYYAVHVGLLSSPRGGLHSVSIYHGRNNLKNSRFRTDDRAGLLKQIKDYCDEVRRLDAGRQRVHATVEPVGHVTQDQAIALVKADLRGIPGIEFQVDTGKFYVTIDVTTRETSQAMLDLNVQDGAFRVAVWHTHPESGNPTTEAFSRSTVSPVEFRRELKAACALVRKMI